MSGTTSRTSSRASGGTSPAATPAPSNLPPVTRALVLAVAAALLVPLSFAILARAQTRDTRNRALIVLDASKSMNEDAHDGGTRLDAAKRAVGELLDHLPPGVPLG